MTPALHAPACEGALGPLRRALADASPASVGEPDAEGWAPLHLAASRGDDALAERLLAAGASSVPMDDGQTPADLVAARGFPGLAACLRALDG